MTWKERNAAAEKVGFTAKDREDAREWAACAVSEYEGKFTEADDLPADLVLLQLGVDFAEYVFVKNVVAAKRAHAQIGRRVRFLQRQAARAEAEAAQEAAWDAMTEAQKAGEVATWMAE